MVFIHGQELLGSKTVRFALRRFPSIGKLKSQIICNKALIHEQCKVRDLTEVQLHNIRQFLAPYLEKDKQDKMKRIKELKTCSKPIEKT